MVEPGQQVKVHPAAESWLSSCSSPLKTFKPKVDED